MNSNHRPNITVELLIEMFSKFTLKDYFLNARSKMIYWHNNLDNNLLVNNYILVTTIKRTQNNRNDIFVLALFLSLVNCRFHPEYLNDDNE